MLQYLAQEQLGAVGPGMMEGFLRRIGLDDLAPDP